MYYKLLIVYTRSILVTICCLVESVSTEATPDKPSATDSATRPVDISRLNIRVGKVLSVEKVCTYLFS